MEPKKLENGHEYPATAYLIVPDAQDPTTWRLRVWGESSQTVSEARLHQAAQALGTGPRARKLLITAEQRTAALQRLRFLFYELGAESLPAVLGEAMHADAMKRAKKAMPKAKRMKAMKTQPKGMHEAEDPESLLAELAEAYHSMDYMMAMHDGDLSFESLTAACSAALERKHQAEHLQGEGASEHPYNCRMELRATFPGSCVYEMKGKLYQASFGMTGTDAKIGDDAVEVTAEFRPAATHVQEAREADLWEPWAAREPALQPLTEAKRDRERGVMFGTVLLNHHSVNGEGDKGRDYTEPAMRRLAQMAEGVPAYANHVADKAKAFQPRDVRDMIGVHRNVRYDADRRRVVSDFHVMEHHRPWVFGIAEEAPAAVGFSPVARGLVRMQNGKEIVEDIVAVRSGDLVTDPATTKGLFESRTDWRMREEDGMELTVTAVIEWLKAKPAEGKLLMEYLAGDQVKDLTAAKQKTEEDLKAERDEHGKTKTALTEAQAKVDGYKATEALREKQGRLETAIAESDLGKKYTSVPEAASPRFRQMLLEGKEEEWAGHIEERCKLLAGATAGGERPRAAGKGQTLSEAKDNGLPEGAHARLAAALR